jgi:solute carrier family 25 (mitochondrial 2-oxodicarboxylate transporter), member 21
LVKSVTRLFREEGLKGTFRGVSSPLMGSIPMGATIFGAHSICANWLTDGKMETLTPGQNLLAGMFSGLAETAISNPVDAVKVLMQDKASPHPTSFSALRHIVATQGPMGVYTGSFPQLIKNASANGAFFAGIYTGDQLINSLSPENYQSALKYSGVSGVLGGFFSMSVSAPAEVVSTLSKGGAFQGQSNWQIATHVFKTAGVRGFYTSLPAKLARACPGGLLMVQAYRGFSALLGVEEK